MKFVDRRRELRALNLFYETPRAGLMILYGRRRVGKTSLLTHWLDRRFGLEESTTPSSALYWMATTHSADYQLRDFSQSLVRLDSRNSAALAPTFSFASWEAAFDYIADLAHHRPPNQPLVIIIDEFTYLAQSDPALVSVLQRAWDHRLSREDNVRLIISGSLIGVMEKQVLSAQSPMYGRASVILKLPALEFGTLREIFPGWSPAERVAAFAVCGGIPAYLDLFTRAKNFNDGLLQYCLTPNSIMLSDAALLLNERLHEPRVYEAVLSSVASGCHDWSDIARMSQQAESALGQYMQTLQDLEMIRRLEPVLSEPGNRRGRYFISDPFLRFYYRFIVPHRSAIQRGGMARTLQTIREDLRAFIGTYVWEQLCQDYCLIRAEQGQLGWLPEEIGSFWMRHRGNAVQLDVVAASRRAKRLLIGEAKWGDDPIGRSILTDLFERSQRMPQVADGWQTEYAVFARGGFSPAAQALAHERGVRLVELGEVEQAHAEFVEMAAG